MLVNYLLTRPASVLSGAAAQLSLVLALTQCLWRLEAVKEAFVFTPVDPSLTTSNGTYVALKVRVRSRPVERCAPTPASRRRCCKATRRGPRKLHPPMCRCRRSWTACWCVLPRACSGAAADAAPHRAQATVVPFSGLDPEQQFEAMLKAVHCEVRPAARACAAALSSGARRWRARRRWRTRRRAAGPTSAWETTTRGCALCLARRLSQGSALIRCRVQVTGWAGPHNHLREEEMERRQKRQRCLGHALFHLNIEEEVRAAPLPRRSRCRAAVVAAGGAAASARSACTVPLPARGVQRRCGCGAVESAAQRLDPLTSHYLSFSFPASVRPSRSTARPRHSHLAALAATGAACAPQH